MSGASRQTIEGWLHRLYDDDDLTHMIVMCDTYDHSDYPVYVSKDEDVREVEAKCASESMQMVMEVYSANHTLEDQMAERRAFHYD